ncbi:MAG: hypothetical protein WDO73_34800 [Ignavibacteriota bacterium]
MAEGAEEWLSQSDDDDSPAFWIGGLEARSGGRVLLGETCYTAETPRRGEEKARPRLEGAEMAEGAEGWLSQSDDDDSLRFGLEGLRRAVAGKALPGEAC